MQRKYMAIVQLVTSDWPSVCGWKAVLMRSLTPDILNRSHQTALVNTGSRSLTMDAGRPWRRTIWLKNALAGGRSGCPKAMKWAYLEKRFKTVRMTDLPYPRGSPSMKSMDMSAQTWDGTSSGCRRPAD
ncbi:LOW QUALITY PROTEIN: hypothetical protein U9M48_008045 [Paspalum notatum var. saurae]|uniref:Uncharacterized protein n=1 Tax=Paspalum notatum var. saurae TaxID=547442 RepID=A0AAQ3SNU2_PASNO